MPGARCAPAAPRAKNESTQNSHHRSRRSTGIPCAMVLTAYGALSPAIGFLAAVPAQCETLSRVDASIEASGPHALAVRLSHRSSVDAKASTASRVQRFVTIAIRPLMGCGTRQEVPLICPSPQARCLRQINATGKSGELTKSCQVMRNCGPDRTREEC